jgi:GTP-binding protein Era
MDMKEGIVLLLGRPNVGKSTFVNNVIGQKVSITSEASNTRMPSGLYEEEEKIIFKDTAGILIKQRMQWQKR